MVNLKTKISVRVDEWHDWTDEGDCLLYNAALVSHYGDFCRDSIQGDDDIKSFLLLFFGVFDDFERDLFSFDLSRFRDFCKNELSKEFRNGAKWFEYDFVPGVPTYGGCAEYWEVRSLFLEFFKKWDGKTLHLQELRGYSQGDVWSLYSFEKWDQKQLDYLTDCLCGCSFYCIARECNYETVDSICGVYIPDLYSGNTEAKNIEVAKKAIVESALDILDGLSDDEIVWDFSF